MLRIYVIAAYSHAPAVRAIHARLRAMGHEPTSSWAETAEGAEDLSTLTAAECLAIWKRNDADMQAADVAIVLANTPCREGFMEAQRVLFLLKRVVWVGRPTLTVRAFACEATRLTLVPDIDAALHLLERRDTLPAGEAVAT